MGLDLSKFNAEFSVALEALDPAEMSRQFAASARAARDEAIAAGQGSPNYTLYVNRRVAETEEGADPDYPIIYEFNWYEEAIFFLLNFLPSRYPVYGPARGGHYKDAHRAYVNGRIWKREPIDPAAEVIVVNTQPYARKVHVGAKGFALGKGIMEDARQALLREFRGTVRADIVFVALPDGYILKGRRPVRRAKQNARSSAFRAGRSTLANRKDTDAGQPLKYPALKLERLI